MSKRKRETNESTPPSEENADAKEPQAKKPRTIKNLANALKKIAVNPGVELVAETFFDIPSRFLDDCNLLRFKQVYYNDFMPWSPFAIWRQEKIDGFRDIGDKQERKAQILAELLSHSALNHYGSYEISLLLDYVFIPSAYRCYGIPGTKELDVIKRAAEIMEIPFKEVQKMDGALWSRHIGISNLQLCEEEFQKFGASRHLTERQAKEKIFWSFMLSIAEGGCKKRTMMNSQGKPKFHSIIARTY